MAVLQMQRFSICALKRDRKAILEELQALGVMEIEGSVAEDAGMQQMDTLVCRQIFEKRVALAENALEVLQKYVPEKSSLLAALAGKTPVSKAEFDRVVSSRKKLMIAASQLVAMEKEISENQANIARLENQIEELAPWLSLDIPMNFPGTDSAAVLTGSVPGQMSAEEIRTAVARTAPELEAYDVNVLSAWKDMTCLTAVCLETDAERLEDALRAVGFSRPSQQINKVPSRQKAEYEEEIRRLKAKTEKLEKKIQKYADIRDDLKTAADYYRIRDDKYQVLGGLYQSEQTFLISGYVKKKDAAGLQEKLQQEYVCQVDVQETDENEDIPVALENGTFAGSVEGVLASFGLPAKGEMDPSKLMAVFYVFLFGLMLSDAAYGLIVFGACFLALKKFPRMSESLAKSVRLFMYCGLSTLFWGVMFGGFFGDLITVVASTFFGLENVAFPTVWFAPLDEPMRLLIYSMLFGLIHLYVGLGAKGYMCIRDKRYLDFVCDVVFWYLMLTGLVLILLPSDLFVSISQMNITFPAAVNVLAKWMAVIGAVGILLMSGRSNKNPALRIALGAYDLYNITGWVSDILSYSRLLALGLATGVIASVVNQMGSMLGGGIPGALLFIFAFCIGHTFNLAINLLGAYVHTCRLQYVEFFGKFYEGGGRAFAPFKENTKYVVKEETKL